MFIIYVCICLFLLFINLTFSANVELSLYCRQPYILFRVCWSHAVKCLVVTAMARSCVDDDIDFATPYCTKVPKAKKASSVTGVPAYSKHKAQASARTTSSGKICPSASPNATTWDHFGAALSCCVASRRCPIDPMARPCA